MAYATVNDIANRMTRALSDEELNICNALLDDATVIIDSYNPNAKNDNKKVVCCRMVIRALGNGENSIPTGATQGSMSGLGYSSSWSISSGSVGELYITKVEKKLLGVSGLIGSHSPIECVE